MTNKNYKNVAQKILEECDELENDNYTITTISELFFLRLRKALLKYESKESSYTIAKELNNIQDVSDENDNHHLLIKNLTLMCRYIPDLKRSMQTY